MYSKKIVVSGSVGQVALAANKAGTLRGYSLVASGAVRMQIRQGTLGGTSGELVWEDRSVTSAGKPFIFPDDSKFRFDRGMHVTIIGTGGTAYMLLD